jgi:hypothetical protein
MKYFERGTRVLNMTWRCEILQRYKQPCAFPHNFFLGAWKPLPLTTAPLL